jgi:hypothetical protein
MSQHGLLSSGLIGSRTPDSLGQVLTGAAFPMAKMAEICLKLAFTRNQGESGLNECYLGPESGGQRVRLTPVIIWLHDSKPI